MCVGRRGATSGPIRQPKTHHRWQAEEKVRAGKRRVRSGTGCPSAGRRAGAAPACGPDLPSTQGRAPPSWDEASVVCRMAARGVLGRILSSAKPGRNRRGRWRSRAPARRSPPATPSSPASPRPRSKQNKNRRKVVQFC